MDRKRKKRSRETLNPNSRIKRCGHHLPEDLLTEILTRLPSKSLIRFRCVCKSWNSLITSPTFIAAHRDLSRNTNNPLLLIHSYYEQNKNLKHSFSLQSDCNASLKLHSDLELPFQIKKRHSYLDSQDVSIIGSCNGIVCLFHDPSFILWNPSIKKVIRLPDPTSCCCPFGIKVGQFVGFCFDSRSNDYKVVRVVNTNWKEKHIFQTGIYEVEIYSLNAGSWRIIDSGLPRKVHLRFFHLSRAFMNGALHWLARNVRKSPRLFKQKNYILSFDLIEESCKKIAFPKRLAKLESEKMSISVFENKYLAVIQYKEELNFHVWVMKEYGVVESWIKLFSIDPINVSPAKVRPLVFRKNGEILMEKTMVKRLETTSYPRRSLGRSGKHSSELMSFDPQSQQIRLEMFGDKENFEADSYVESLVLLNESKCTNFLEAEEKIPCERCDFMLLDYFMQE